MRAGFGCWCDFLLIVDCCLADFHLSLTDFGVFSQCITWNLNGKIPDEDLAPLLLSKEGGTYDMYVIGTQESGGTIRRGLLPGRGALGAWESLLAAALGPRYTMVAAHALAATHIAVFVRQELLPLVRHVRSAHVATGFGNKIGNKGGVAVGLSIGPDERCAWDVEREQLVRSGVWAAPAASGEDDDGKEVRFDTCIYKYTIFGTLCTTLWTPRF